MAANYGAVIDVDDADLEEDLGEADLEFRDFTTEINERHYASNVPFNQRRVDSRLKDNGKKLIWSLGYYSQFFDVDTDQVARRCIGSLYPKEDFLDVVGGTPDLYGPFWVTTTVIFVLYTTSTLAAYLAAYHTSEKFSYDFALLTSAAALTYGYAGIVPVVLWLALKYYSCEPNLLECICLYGYGGLLVWIPVSIVVGVIEIINYSSIVSIVQWSSVAIGFALSASFLVRNLYPVVSRADAKTSRLVVVVVIALQAALSIAVKFVFFRHPH